MATFVHDIFEKYAGKEAAEYFSWFVTFLCSVASNINDRLVASGASHLTLVLLAFVVGFLLSKLHWFLCDNLEPPFIRLRNTLFRFVKRIPPIRKYIAAKMAVAKKSAIERYEDPTDITPEEQRLLTVMPRIPNEGMPSEEIMKRLAVYSKVLADDGKAWKSGKISGAIYHLRKDLDDLAVEIFRRQLHANPLHFDVFGDARRCEAELVSWVWRLFNGPPNESPSGAITTGGTESIILAVLASRNRALARGVRWPEVVACTSAHCALEKAAEMFRIRVVKTEPVWPSGEADVKAFRKAITKNTCMLYASAPGFPWGTVDPVKEIASLGLKYDIPVHVDCCLGGFVAPFAVEAGFPFTNGPVDFRNEGVTSISVDTHKYGFAPKGTSVVLYRNTALRAHQLFVAPDWPGGVYATTAMSGSRSGAVVVCAWASLLHVGFSGYVESARQICTAAKKITERIAAIPGLEVLGRSDLCAVAWRIAAPIPPNCIYLALDRMTKRGWHLTALQNPSGAHIAMTDFNSKPDVVDMFLGDLAATTKETLDAVKAGKEDAKSGAAALYGTTQSIPDRSIVVDFVKDVVQATHTI